MSERYSDERPWDQLSEVEKATILEQAYPPDTDLGGTGIVGTTPDDLKDITVRAARETSAERLTQGNVEGKD